MTARFCIVTFGLRHRTLPNDCPKLTSVLSSCGMTHPGLMEHVPILLAGLGVFFMGAHDSVALLETISFYLKTAAYLLEKKL